MSYEARTRGVRVDLVDTAGFDGGPGERDKLSGVENVVGGSAGDVLIGNEVRNNFEGGAGDDRVAGGDGWDILAGGDGNDVIDGGLGRDRIYGGAGKNILRGGAGEDDVQAGGDGATIDGGAGVAPRKTIRRGSLLDVSISGAVYVANYPGGQTKRVTASWRVRS